MKLERAKTGDFLKHKIQRRPQRDELIQHHILEDSFDQTYYEQERKLKRARLADDLNERLSHRPGPLELIKGNILHTDEFLEQAIKDGQITFKKTCEGEIIKNPPKRFVFEEESSSDSAPSPLQNNRNLNATLNSTQSPSTSSFLLSQNGSIISMSQQLDQSVTIPPTASSILNSGTNRSYMVTKPMTSLPIQPDATSNASTTTLFIAPNQMLTNVVVNNQTDRSTSITSGNNSIASLGHSTLPSTSTTTFVLNNDSIGSFGPTATSRSSTTSTSSSIITSNQKSKKRIKSKTTPKARVIKFHEYTGPPSARKQSSSNQSCPETSYQLLLKQQQLFLQWQLESQQNQQTKKVRAFTVS